MGIGSGLVNAGRGRNRGNPVREGDCYRRSSITPDWHWTCRSVTYQQLLLRKFMDSQESQIHFENPTICRQPSNKKKSKIKKAAKTKNRVQSLRISKGYAQNSLSCYYWTGPDVQTHQVTQARCQLRRKFIWNFRATSEGQYWLKAFPFQDLVPQQIGIIFFFFLPSFELSQ